MSSYEDNDLKAMNHLEDLLDAYCEARLAPRSAVLARIRANVLAEAGATAANTAPVNRLHLVESRPAPIWARVPRLSRAVMGLGFAAALALGTSAAVLAAPPGSAFYNARLYIETLTLPTQVGARFTGHEQLLAERMREVESAADAGDTAGLAAALAAYQDEVDAASLAAGNDPDRLAHLEEMLAKHSAVLTALAQRLPEQSDIENALESSSKAIARLQAKSHPAHPPRGGGPGGGQGSGGGSGGGASSDGGPGGAGAVTPTAGPPSHVPTGSTAPAQGGQGQDGSDRQ